ncbi:MAG: biotin-dependent carboxyltransferase family protein [Chloroflexota bacterium]|nr:biotin-dependent carboxyltransferase family protein [Chloroflexota bacterium]
MTPALRVGSPGVLATLQDLGRRGWLRFGVPAAGAMDPIGLAMANGLVGNPLGTAALELTLAGGHFTVENGPVRIAVAGGDFPLAVDGMAVQGVRSHWLEPGRTISLGSARMGAHAYLAVAGGFRIEPVLGSAATHVRSRIGGWHGRPLMAGDVLPLNGMPEPGPERTLAPGFKRPNHPRVRAVLGPQDDYLTPAAIETFLSAEYTITTQADRMGYRLTGPKLEHAKGPDIVSDAIAPGSVQVPGFGEPIVLLADRQTTGGYPKIATVISADLPALGQRRPGDHLRFEAITVEAAQVARRDLWAWLEALPSLLVPVGRELDSEHLLAVNLISGVTNGQGEIYP